MGILCQFKRVQSFYQSFMGNFENLGGISVIPTESICIYTAWYHKFALRGFTVLIEYSPPLPFVLLGGITSLNTWINSVQINFSIGGYQRGVMEVMLKLHFL